MLHIVFLGFISITLAIDLEVQRKYETLPLNEFIEYFNSQNFSWKMTHYDHLNDEYLACAIKDDKKLPYKLHDPLIFDQLPENFDSREKWQNCSSIKDIRNQMDCNSCWAFGTSMTASDRTCIHKGIQVRLSQQDLQCCSDCYPLDVCTGGYTVAAFIFWNNTGLVTDDCKPYNITDLQNGNCELKCKSDSKSYHKDKHHGGEVYSVGSNENQIKAELFKNGPIEASLVVFEDFSTYKGGIYEHTWGHKMGVHSVRLIGYGKDNGAPYWLVANSWGAKWGEKGFFKVKPYQKTIKFEDRLFTGLPRD